MEYTYTTRINKNGVREKDITTIFVEVENLISGVLEFEVEVYDNVKRVFIQTLSTQEDILSWRTKLERDHVWMTQPKSKQEIQKDINNLTLAQLTYNTHIDTMPIKAKDHINPTHYQSYCVDQSTAMSLQWLETMCRIQRYRERPDEFIAAVELQVRKYLDRNGGKDEELQELEKGLWYYKFMVAFIKNGKKPILVKDIERILEGA